MSICGICKKEIPDGHVRMCMEMLPKPLITIEQLTELMRLVSSCKTQEIERSVANALYAIVKPPYIYIGDVGLDIKPTPNNGE